MEGRTIALALVVPAAAVFVWAGWREFRRFRAEGPSSYGLTYDPDTNTTHVGPLPEGESGYDPEEFEPANDTGPDAADGSQPDEREDPDAEPEQENRR